MLISDDVLMLAAEAKSMLEKNNMKISFAESCSGGLLSTILVSIAGASKVFDRSFIVYSDQAKSEVLGIDDNIIAKYGAVSGEVASAMASSLVRKNIGQIGSGVLGVSITGVFGPDGGTEEKPIGLFYTGYCFSGGEPDYLKLRINVSNRNERRLLSANMVYKLINELLSDYNK